MQDIHSIGSGGGGGGGGRLYGSGGDRRLRPHHHHNHGHGPPALKCPRCESLNTKFCYYNNYNLSQPRHFCKSCRRYWTKGGVLRNVPVGGGCRKTKRSKSKSSNTNNNRSSESGVRKSSNSQNSSSDSSSLTANTTAANTTVKPTATVAVTAAEVLSGNNSTNSAPTLINFQESSTGFVNITQSSVANPSFDPPLLDHSSAENNIFPEIGTFTSLINSSTAESPLGFNISADISPFRLHHTDYIVENSNANLIEQQWMHTDHTIGDDLKIHETGPLGFMDAHTTQTEFSELQKKTTDGGLDTEDWNNGTDQALFDLTGTVDQSYWSQTQWDGDDHDHDHGHHHDHQLNFLP